MGWKAKEISKFYEDREHLQEEEAVKLFGDAEILNNKDGFKLCVYLALNRYSSTKIFNLVSRLVVKSDGKLKVKHLESLGRLILQIFSRTSDGEQNSEKQSVGSKKEIVDKVFKPFMEMAILSKNQDVALAARQIFKASVAEKRKDLSVLLSLTSAGIIWKYINSPNDFIRLGATFIQQNLFPPTFEDKIEEATFFEKHLGAFKNALQDPSLPIRLQAIEEVTCQIAFWFEDIPSKFMNEFTGIVEKLFVDQNWETRAAVFRAFRYFAAQVSARSQNYASSILKRHAANGIDDVSDGVRVSAFKLLNVFCKSDDFKMTNFISMEAVVNRLDYDENDKVEEQAAQLLLKGYFNAKSTVERLIKLMKFCDMNKKAAVDFHRVIIEKELLSKPKVLSYICELVEFVPAFLNKYAGKEVDLDKEIDNQLEKNRDRPKRLDTIKGVFDCLIVSFTLIQPDLVDICGTQSQDVEISMVKRTFKEAISIVFESFEDHEGLMDSALTLALVSPKSVVCMPKFKLECERGLRTGHLDERRLQVFAMSDMEKVLQIIDEGLQQTIRNSTNLLSSPRPPPKKPRLSSVFLKEITVLEALESLLTGSITNDYLMTAHDLYVDKFIESLAEIRENYLLALKPKRSRPLNIALLVKVMDSLTVLLILKHTDGVSYNNNTEPKKPQSDKKRTPSRSRKRKREVSLDSMEEDKDPLRTEVMFYEKLFTQTPDALMKNEELISAVYRTCKYQASAYPHKASVLEDAQKFLESLYDYQCSHPRLPQTVAIFEEARGAVRHALEFSLPENDPQENGDDN